MTSFRPVWPLSMRLPAVRKRAVRIHRKAHLLPRRHPALVPLLQAAYRRLSTAFTRSASANTLNASGLCCSVTSTCSSWNPSPSSRRTTSSFPSGPWPARIPSRHDSHERLAERVSKEMLGREVSRPASYPAQPTTTLWSFTCRDQREDPRLEAHGARHLVATWPCVDPVPAREPTATPVGGRSPRRSSGFRLQIPPESQTSSAPHPHLDLRVGVRVRRDRTRRRSRPPPGRRTCRGAPAAPSRSRGSLRQPSSWV